MSYELFKKDFKRDLLVRIALSMKHDLMTRETAADLSAIIMAIMKEEDAQIVFEKINKVSETYPTILDIFLKRGKEFEERSKMEKIDLVKQSLNNYSMEALYAQGGDN